MIVSYFFVFVKFEKTLPSKLSEIIKTYHLLNFISEIKYFYENDNYGLGHKPWHSGNWLQMQGL